jgi:hypothetical protein
MKSSVKIADVWAENRTLELGMRIRMPTAQSYAVC